jgi:formylglycine-generating enzyme required for sulfatase activity/tetratricopeptide (TPR) repeat protein
MNCPPREQLERLLSEQLNGPEAGRLEEHLEECGRCQGALAELFEPVPAGPADATTNLRAACDEPRPEFLRRLREALPSAAHSPTPKSDDTPIVGTETERRPSPLPIPRVSGYELLAELGRGGIGLVYRARHLALRRQVALKMILAGAHAGAGDRARFKAEAEAVARLQHPNIVQIFEVGEEDGCPYLALEYVDGGTLAEKLKGTPVPAREAAALAETLARAVHAAHRDRIVHRDLKPANVLLTSDGAPKIADFGLAKSLGSDHGQTLTGSVLGTPSYMAPEQAGGRGREVNAAIDIYALGAILYEMLTGRPPFKGESPADTLQQVQFSEPVPPGQLQPKLPRDLETICLKCLNKEPRKRYPSAEELADDLRRFLGLEPIRARRTPATERFVRWARRNRGVAALATVAVLLLLTVAGVSSYSAFKLDRERNAVLASQVDSLLTANPDGVPFIVDTLKARKVEVLPKLAGRSQLTTGTFSERLRLNVALAAMGEDRTHELCKLAAETPSSESFNLLLGLKCGERRSTVEQLDAQYRDASEGTARTRLSIALLELGDPRAARVELAERSNPTARVRFIHVFPNWRGDLADVLELMRSLDDSAFRSGLCLAVGSIDPARLLTETQRNLDSVLTELYSTARDGATHSAAAWALAHRGVSLPAIAASQGPLEGRQWFVNSQGMTMIAIEPGVFQPRDYEVPLPGDQPLRAVVLTRPLFVMDQIVTADWFRRFLRSSDHPPGEKLDGIAQPAELGDSVRGWDWHLPTLSRSVAVVDWASAILFCNWLSRVEGRTPCYRPDSAGRLGYTCDFQANGYRLPTDAEWEYLFRCGTTTRYVIGDDVSQMHEYGRIFDPDVGGGKKTFPNPWGLFDLMGNWWQMCWDDGYDQVLPGVSVNPAGEAGDTHTIRGGSFDAGLYYLHGSFRSWNNLTTAALFRVVCGPLTADGLDRHSAALATLTRWMERFPDSEARIRRAQGRLYAEMGDVEKAAAAYLRNLELRLDAVQTAADLVRRDNVFARVTALRPDDPTLWWKRTDWLGQNGRWSEASIASARAVELAPQDAYHWYIDAALRLGLGDEMGYRRDCMEMAARFPATQDDNVANMLVKTCLLLPDALPDRKMRLENTGKPHPLARHVVVLRWLMVCRALSEYRAGNFNAAVEEINHVAPTMTDGALGATAFILRALSEHCRGHPAEARTALMNALAIRSERWLFFCHGQPFSGDWHDWLRFEALRRQAEALIN